MFRAYTVQLADTAEVSREVFTAEPGDVEVWVRPSIVSGNQSVVYLGGEDAQTYPLYVSNREVFNTKVAPGDVLWARLTDGSGSTPDTANVHVVVRSRGGTA
jgi:hypothetical protein